MTIEIISLSIYTKVWDRTGIKLATPGSAVRLAIDTKSYVYSTVKPQLPVLRGHSKRRPKLFFLSPITA